MFRVEDARVAGRLQLRGLQLHGPLRVLWLRSLCLVAAHQRRRRPALVTYRDLANLERCLWHENLEIRCFFNLVSLSR